MNDERRDMSLLMIETSAADTVTSVVWACPAGTTARIVGAWLGKTDPAARTVSWGVNDGTGIHECSNVKTMTAVAERFPLYENGNMAEGLILHQDWTLVGLFSAMAAATHCFMLVLVEYRRGETNIEGT